jgi:hypothetical protein
MVYLDRTNQTMPATPWTAQIKRACDAMVRFLRRNPKSKIHKAPNMVAVRQSSKFENQVAKLHCIFVPADFFLLILTVETYSRSRII